MKLSERLNPGFIPPQIDRSDDLLILRERGLQYILLLASIVGIIAFVQAIFIFIPRQDWLLLFVYSAILTATVALALLRTISFNTRVYIILLLLHVMGITGLVESGLSGSGKVFLLSFSILAAILLGIRPGIFCFVISLASYALIGWMMTSQIISVPPINVLASSGSVPEWINDGLLFALLMTMIVSTVNSLNHGIESAIQSQRRLSSELLEERDSLENRVQERTQELEKRITQVEAAATLARDISINIEVETLLNNAVELIRERFGFYHAGIFLIDERNEYAILRSATGEAGRVMLENEHKLKVGEVGIVGYVVSTGESRITLNVEEDAFHYKNPLLPDTRSEMALPLRIGEKIIGALDVQSTRPHAFTTDDVNILQTLADQIAVAIDKTRLVKQLQDSLHTLEASTVKFTEQTWANHLRNVRKSHAYRYRHGAIEELSPEALSTGETTVKNRPEVHRIQEKGKPHTIIALPIKLRGHVVGVLDLKFESETITPAVMGMLETISDRLAVALENVRLLEEIQFRAEREHLVGDIASRVRSETEVADILRTAAIEIGRKMGIAEVVVQLRSDE